MLVSVIMYSLTVQCTVGHVVSANKTAVTVIKVTLWWHDSDVSDNCTQAILHCRIPSLSMQVNEEVIMTWFSSEQLSAAVNRINRSGHSVIKSFFNRRSRVPLSRKDSVATIQLFCWLLCWTTQKHLWSSCMYNKPQKKVRQSNYLTCW